MSERDLPLRAQVEGDQFVIRIGLDTLQFAAEHCQRFYDYDKHAPEGPYVKIVDRAEFAADIVRAMQAEEEDGSTPLSDFVDQMFIDAWEDGSAGFDYDDDGETPAAHEAQP